MYVVFDMPPIAKTTVQQPGNRYSYRVQEAGLLTYIGKMVKVSYLS